MNSRLLFVLLLSLSVEGVLQAQSVDSQRIVSSGSFPSVFESLITRYRFERDGSDSKEVKGSIRVLNTNGVLQRSQVTFAYHPNSETLHIKFVRVKRRTKTSMILQDYMSSRPQESGKSHYDYNEKIITIPKLSVGDLLEYDVVTIRVRPVCEGQIVLQHSFNPGALSERLEVVIPFGRKIVVKAPPRAGLKFSQISNRALDIYRWDLESVGPRPESFGSSPEVQVSSFLNWAQVGHWYASLERNHTRPNPEIKAKAAELTKGLGSDIERVEALYNFTAKRIKYISLASLGIGGYEPHSAEETMRNGYGDCKDKAALLRALLKSEGFETASVLISSDREIDADVPSPLAFDHVIVTLRIGNAQIWMDPSPAVLPFRMLAYNLRDKESLVISPEASPHLERTPSQAPIANNWFEEVEGRIASDGTLDATVKVTARGDSELAIRQAFINPIESVWPTTVQGVVYGLNRRTDKISDVKISDPRATNEPFSLSFHLSRQVLLTRESAQFSLPLGDFHLPSIAENTQSWASGPDANVDLGPPGVRTYKVILTLPESWKLHPPKALELKSECGVYDAIYTLEGSSLLAERTLRTACGGLQPFLREPYNSFREEVLAESGQPIVVSVPH